MDYKQKIYAFFFNSEYHLIGKIGEDKYGIVPMFTDSYGIEEVITDSLEKTLQLCHSNYEFPIHSFNTYNEFFTWCMSKEAELEQLDLFGIKDMTGRHFYVEDNIERLQKDIFKKSGV